MGIQTLTIGYTKDIELAEAIAREAGVKELSKTFHTLFPPTANTNHIATTTIVIRTCPEGEDLFLSRSERAKWIERGWRLVGRTARKTLINESPEQPASQILRQRDADANLHRQKHKMQREMSIDGYSEGGRLKANMEVGSRIEREMG